MRFLHYPNAYCRCQVCSTSNPNHRVSATKGCAIRFMTPKTSVRRDPINIIAVRGYSSIIGTDICPQLSPAITVLNRSTFACMTEDVDFWHSRQSSKTSSIKGLTSSTIRSAQTVIMTKQNMNDQNSVFKQVDNMRISFCNSRKPPVRLRTRVTRRIRTNRSILNTATLLMRSP